VIIGLAMFLTFFVMAPVWQQIHSQALQPYLAKEISQEEGFHRALEPVRAFMLKQTRERDLGLFLSMAQQEQPCNRDDVPTLVLIPSFIISELKTAFQIGFRLYIPFLVLDMVVASGLIFDGHDDAPTGGHLLAAQTHALRVGRWLVFGRGIAGEEFSMTADFIVGITKEALQMTVMLAAPVLGVGLVLDLLMSISQAVTQLQEMTLTFIPKFLGVSLVLVILSPWMLELLVSYTTTLIENIPLYIR
jgi:flagellar biosynthetic protein FliQ